MKPALVLSFNALRGRLREALDHAAKGGVVEVTRRKNGRAAPVVVARLMPPKRTRKKKVAEGPTEERT